MPEAIEVIRQQRDQRADFTEETHAKIDAVLDSIDLDTPKSGSRPSVAAPDSDSGASIKNRDGQTLRVASEQETAALARAILFDEKAVSARKDMTPEDYAGHCLAEATKLQADLAARGIYAPVINAADGSASGRVGHRFVVVGNQIMDPTFAQFFDKSSSRQGGNEPFVGTYHEMVERLAQEGIANPKEMLKQQWGLIEPGEDGNVRFDTGVKPLQRDEAIVPKTADEVRRLMEDQAKVGIEPGQGLPPKLVRQVKGESEPEAAAPTTQATPAAPRSR